MGEACPLVSSTGLAGLWIILTVLFTSFIGDMIDLAGLSVISGIFEGDLRALKGFTEIFCGDTISGLGVIVLGREDLGLTVSFLTSIGLDLGLSLLATGEFFFGLSLSLLTLTFTTLTVVSSSFIGVLFLFTPFFSSTGDSCLGELSLDRFLSREGFSLGSSGVRVFGELSPF